jgi:hypothetical protein
MTQGELLAEQLQGSREWTLKLLADIKGEEWTYQPGRGLAHPLWICGHLAASQDLLVFVRCLKRPATLDTGFTSHFGIGGPVLAAGEHPFPSPQAVLETMHQMHERTLTAVRGMSDELLNEPAFAADGKSPHPHYRDKRGAVVHCGRHEAFHAGQLALIRRLLGKAFLR